MYKLSVKFLLTILLGMYLEMVLLYSNSVLLSEKLPKRFHSACTILHTTVHNSSQFLHILANTYLYFPFFDNGHPK